ncbi:SDR family oxidoreductase [Desulfococcaceae bacterium HSG9]|nr:SDR family oxidoreductase [Desulfococcaceae bacterium HSG9]
MKLLKRHAIITGANQGLGLAIAEEFVKEGASVVICARNALKLNNVAQKLNRFINNDEQQVIAVPADVSNENDVKHLTKVSIRELNRVDILVNNAGVQGPLGLVENNKSQDWIKTVEINLFGVFFTSKSIIPHMKANRYGKIINLSGGGATSPRPRVSAYAAAKAAVVRLTETLAEEYREFNIDINAIAPGALNTRMLEDVLEAGAEVIGENIFESALQQKNDGGIPLEQGASLCAYLASSVSDGISGKLISAVWDPWENLHNYVKPLQRTDIFTLRRIIPEDREQTWKSE